MKKIKLIKLRILECDFYSFNFNYFIKLFNNILYLFSNILYIYILYIYKSGLNEPKWIELGRTGSNRPSGQK